MFIALTILFITGNAAMAFILYLAIQKGQIFDLLFGWQKMLRKQDLKGTTSGMVLHKILGGCLLCFSHLIAFLGFWIYVIFSIRVGTPLGHWLLWFPVYMVYVPAVTTLTLYIHKKIS